MHNYQYLVILKGCPLLRGNEFVLQSKGLLLCKKPFWSAYYKNNNVINFVY